MPEVTISVGGRAFTVACQAGEEDYLRAAARMLDAEATALLGQIGRMPEARMLLMAGLMLADRTAALEDQLREAQAMLAQREADLVALAARPAPPPQRVEVPVLPPGHVERLSELVARAEALAASSDERARR
jgi:cell division protein ZapA